VGLRSKEKAKAEKRGIKLTILPFIIKAAIAGLVEHPYLNATLDDENEEVILKKYYNIGVAVDTPEGLMVPVVKTQRTNRSFNWLRSSLSYLKRRKTGPLTWLISKGVLHHQQLWGCRRAPRNSDHQSSGSGHPGRRQD